MIDGALQEIEDGEATWADRCHHWIEKRQEPTRPRRRRERNKEALILSGHGASLRVDNGTLLIRDGFTHYPQKQTTHRFFRGDLGLPSRILLLDGSGSISFNVLSWLSEQRVPLVRITGDGAVASVLGAAGYSADGTKVRWQIDTRTDETRRLDFSIDIVRRKLIISITTLEELISPLASRERALAKARDASVSLSSHAPADLTALRLVEAQCASSYFSAWKGIALNWKSTARRPVPDDWRSFTSRTSLANGRKLKNVNASHPLNAILNYAYAVLQSELQIQAVADGYDPTIGIMHQGRRGAPAFVFDLMEPERPVVDRAVLEFVQSERLDAADFVIREDGVCRLNPEMARVVASLGARRPSTSATM